MGLYPLWWTRNQTHPNPTHHSKSWHIPLWWNTNLPSPNSSTTFGSVYLGVVAKVAFYMRIWRIQKGGESEGTWVCWVCTHVEGRWAILLLWVHSTLMFGGDGEGGLAIKLVYYTRLIGCLVGPLRSHHILMLIQCNTAIANREREFINYIVV